MAAESDLKPKILRCPLCLQPATQLVYGYFLAILCSCVGKDRIAVVEKKTVD